MSKVLQIHISISPIITLLIGGITANYYRYYLFSYILWVLAGIWLIISLIYSLMNKSKKISQSTMGIDADGSILNAPRAKIINQDTGVKSKDSLINIPDAEINDKRKK